MSRKGHKVIVHSPLSVQILEYHKEVYGESYRITVERALQDYMSRMVDKDRVIERWNKHIKEIRGG